ncbi:MAG: hypothetical protein COA78_38555 [Blastopirellula sp.]|nr:MAG: hypothetical protein COA78_38555 [Blastopirellula sp.]
MEDGVITNSDAQAVVDAYNSYTEISPSGTGLRVFSIGNAPEGDIGNHEKHVELYGGDPRFATITGHVFEERSTVRAVPDDVVAKIYNTYRVEKARRADYFRPPLLLDNSELPNLELIGLPLKNIGWLLNGFEDSRDRSKDVQATTKCFYERGLTDAQILTLLHECEGSMAVALDHRKQNYDKASAYLWAHCLDARHAAAHEGFGQADAPDNVDAVDPIHSFLKRYVYVELGERVCDLRKQPENSIVKLTEFKNSTANIRHTVPAPTKADPDREKLEPVHAPWRVHPNRKSVYDVAYKPSIRQRLFRDEHGLQWLNSFHLPEHKGTDVGGGLDVFLRHMEYLLPIDSERKWFIDWLAFIIQRPQPRCKVTPLHVAALHGTGRGWVVELIRKLLGHWNCSKTKMDALCGDGNAGQFNEYLHHSVFCTVEEAKEGDKRWSVSDKIRDTLTETTLPINIKHQRNSTQEVFTNFFMMTNHRDALVIAPHDRRMQVLTGPDELQNSDYYDRLYVWLTGGGPAQLFRWLNVRDIAEFDWRRSTDTPARRWMVASNRSGTEELFWAVKDNLPAPGLTKMQFMEAMRIVSEDGVFASINDRELTKLLRDHAEDKRQIKVEKQTVLQVWIFDKALRKSSRETNTTLREGVLNCGLQFK